MKELNNSQHTLYLQALQNPSKLSEEDLLQLIVRYPFSQPLIFAYEKRQVQSNSFSPNKSLALLYAPSASWLWTFVNAASVEEEAYIEAPEIAEDFVSVDVTESSDEINSEENSIHSFVFDQNVTEEEIVVEKDELDLLVNQGSVLADYFIFDEKTENHAAGIEQVKDKTKEEPENVSLYNDDLLPYSFRWWLHKTRSEHADTYQPFSTGIMPKVTKEPFDFRKLDETVLDQQIKQNIIHFQDPEAKLSEQVKSRPVEPVLPKKTDTIIERFIREEPIIQAPSAENLNNENMARQSAEDNYVFVTETLANIYVNQGLSQKAIAVFEKLILKYPEKKSYFANRIQKLEKNL